jgi:hypothetical protein
LVGTGTRRRKGGEPVGFLTGGFSGDLSDEACNDIPSCRCLDSRSRKPRHRIAQVWRLGGTLGIRAKMRVALKERKMELGRNFTVSQVCRERAARYSICSETHNPYEET